MRCARFTARIRAGSLPRGVYELRAIAVDSTGLRSTVLSFESRTILSFTVA